MNNHFTFVACYYNMHKQLPMMLHSICGQSNPNWELVIIDDVSNTESSKILDDIVKQFSNMGYSDKIFLKHNTEKQWETQNVLEMISGSDDESIICRIDCDDWLTDLDALSILDSVYQQSGCDALWTAHRWGFSDKNISGPLTNGADVYAHPWVTSHLKTFRKKLINNINDVNFRNESGEYVRRCGDQAVYLPVLYRATKPVFLNRVLYHYSIDDVPETYQTDDARFQRDEALFLRRRGFVE